MVSGVETSSGGATLIYSSFAMFASLSFFYFLLSFALRESADGFAAVLGTSP